jgi:hypothetical protein
LLWIFKRSMSKSIEKIFVPVLISSDPFFASSKSSKDSTTHSTTGKNLKHVLVITLMPT